MEQPIIVTKAAGYHVITLNRPEKLNAFTRQMNLDIQAALDAADKDAGCRALLINANGRGFTAGQDLGAISPRSREERQKATADVLEKLYDPIVKRIAAFRMPVVCAVNGIAAGAGVNIALGCDIVIAARSAKFLQPFIKIGLVPDGGGTWYLPRLAGAARARALMMLGETISADDAERFGMIWKVVDDAALPAESVKLVQHLASQPTLALAAIKRALVASETNTLEAQLKLEKDLQVSLSGSPDNVEGVTAFMEKRAPKFTGRD
jgi:2-(1,2-epoxy-1,2-dihydrophenyl)acetyl-CoA isomerase